MPGLQRSRTMPTQRSAPMGTAGRRIGAGAKAKGARAGSVAAKRQASVKRRATKSAYDTAVTAVMDMREEKYFHVDGDVTSHPEAPTEGPKRVSVMAFATTSNIEPAGTAVETYCGHAIKNLNMLRPYKQNAADQLAPYAIEGKHVFPTNNSVSWQINRNWANIGPQGGGAIATNTLANLVTQAVVRCRMIRVTPKLAPGVTTAIAPTDDLFLDQTGLPYSPQSTTFSYTDAEYAVVNRRKYTVLQDIKFNINQPFSQSWVGPQTGGDGRNAHLIPNPRAGSSKKMVTRHQLAAKKGGSVYYEQPDATATVNATTGHRREYIFMHFWYESIDGGPATADPQLPNLGGTGIVPDGNIVTAHWRAESRFKEA